MLYIAVFLVSIIVSLYFGELKQGTVEIFWASSVLLCFLIAGKDILKKNFVIRMPNRWGLLFLTILIVTGVSAYYSASPAYSLSFLIRLTIAWCIGTLFFSLQTNDTDITVYTKGIWYIGAGIACLSIISRLFPSIGTLFPAMNLIFSQSGHNQGANILVTIFPIAVYYAQKEKTKIAKLTAYLLFPTAILLCFSRGAALVAGLYLLWTTMREKEKNTVHIRRLIAVFSGFALLLFLTAFFSVQMTDRIQRLPFGLSQITKSNILSEARLANWNQAVKGFLSRPLIGTGPNTYILTSMRYHQTAIDGSGFAHNWYLQTLSEVGILGAIPIGVLVVFLIRTLRKKRDNIPSKKTHASWATLALIDTVFIALSYSLIEYNLDYCTLWVLLWGTVGLLLPKTEDKNRPQLFSAAITVVCLLFLGAIVGTTLYANTKLNTIETATRRFFLEPYDTGRVERYIEWKNSIGQPITTKEKQLIHVWHRAHPDVLIALANAKSSLPAEERAYWYKTAISLNPLNVSYMQNYLTFLYEQKKPEELRTVYLAFIRHAYVMTQKSKQFSNPIIESSTIIPYLTPELFSLFLGTASYTEVASKTLYFIGLTSLSDAPEMTENAWQLAKDISPNWGSFYIELASYYFYHKKNIAKAKQILTECQTREAPAEGCRRMMEQFPLLPDIGASKDDVRMIPIYQEYKAL